MKKPFIVANVREVVDLYDKEEISFSRMVEMLNEIAEKFYANQIKCIPYQRCPICDGSGKVVAEGFTSSIYSNCPSCNGMRFIPMYPLPSTEQNSFDEGDRPY